MPARQQQIGRLMLADAQDLSLGVSEFVSLVNQTFDFAYPSLTIVGELANLRVSRNKWVYFDLKDEDSSVKFFATVYMLPGPLEDGMLLKVRGTPRLHNQYGFSVNVQSMQPTGEGTIKRAAELLQAKLMAEGLFDPVRKRSLPMAPSRIGLIASGQSAAYADFIKILNARWGGVTVVHSDVQVQGEVAPPQIVAALQQQNAMAEPPEVLVIVRGGGSPEDLAAFSSESVTRAVAGSRVPTLVGIGHEVDVCLAELAADRRASTPSNAAELLVPDKQSVIIQLQTTKQQLIQSGQTIIRAARNRLEGLIAEIRSTSLHTLSQERNWLDANDQLLSALNPTAVLRRGYAIVRQQGKAVRSLSQFDPAAAFSITVNDGTVQISSLTKETPNESN